MFRLYSSSARPPEADSPLCPFGEEPYLHGLLMAPVSDTDVAYAFSSSAAFLLFILLGLLLKLSDLSGPLA